jgi:hypothetical protein
MVRWLFGAAVLGALLASSQASADPDELMPCNLILIKPIPTGGGQFSGLTKFVCRPQLGGSFALPSAGAAPCQNVTLPNGSSACLGFYPAEYVKFSVNTVPPGTVGFANTSCRGVGSPPGANGYVCGRHNPAVPLLLLKRNVVKLAVSSEVPAAFGTNLPYSGDIAIMVVSVGDTDTKRYCGRFPLATAARNDAAEFKARHAPAPTACSPSGAFLDAGDTL